MASVPTGVLSYPMRPSVDVEEGLVWSLDSGVWCLTIAYRYPFAWP